jgi:23S rRNA-/tRNA-specific pseudouridylate synthase
LWACLCSAWCPIFGDDKYGSTLPYKPDAIALDAGKLIIQDPVSKKEMIFEVQAPFFIDLNLVCNNL